MKPLDVSVIILNMSVLHERFDLSHSMHDFCVKVELSEIFSYACFAVSGSYLYTTAVEFMNLFGIIAGTHFETMGWFSSPTVLVCLSIL